MKKIIYASAFLFFASSFLAQTVEFDKDNFPGRKDEFKAARKQLEIGMEFYGLGRTEFEDYKKYLMGQYKCLPVSQHDYMNAGNGQFKLAKSPLTTAYKFNPKNARLNYMLGFIHFFESPGSDETLNLLQSSYNLDNNVELDGVYWLAWAHHLHSNWDEAIKYYTVYLNRLGQKPKYFDDVDDVNKKIAECNNGKKYMANPVRVFVDNLGQNINTSFHEYSPYITTDEEMIIFTARRDNTTGAKKDAVDGDFNEDVYTSFKVKGKWQPSKQLSKNVNTPEHDAAAGFSSDGSKLFVYRNSSKDGGDLYESTLFGTEWEVPIHMNKNINTKFHETSISLSFDGRKLYFVSNKDHGIGYRDIYCSDMDVKGEWGPAKNVGPAINTKYGDEGVFMHPDGVTMYFSSQGHSSMGGYDIFKSTFANGKWGTPENMGYPINGPDDDVFFVVSGSGNKAYFSSSKTGGFGGNDIYRIFFLGPEKSPLLNSQDQLLAMRANPVSNLKTESAVEVKMAKVTILKGVVTDEKTTQPLEASIDLIDNDKNLVLATFKSNSASGKYLVTLPSGKNYGIAVRRDGYLFHSENFNIPEGADYQEFNKDVALKKIEIGNTIILKNIFFDFNKATIRPESANELERLIKLLNDNPTLKVELGSHTDSKGSDDYNMKLSDSRSKSVVEYLINKGIPTARLVAKGYGETKPIDTNDTDDGRQNNRRTEFKILEK